MAQNKADEASCLQQFPVTPRHNNVAQARCMCEADRRAWIIAERDLLELYCAKRIAAATRMDEGTITQEDGNALIAQAASEAISEFDRRANSSRSAAAQESAAAAASAPRFCNVNGNIISCF